MSFSFSSSAGRKKKVKRKLRSRKETKGIKRNACTSQYQDDDGLESFGVFNLTQAQSKVGNSKFVPAPVEKCAERNAPSVEDIISRLKAKTQGRSTIPVPKVTPVTKNAHESSSNLKRKSKYDTTSLKRSNSEKQRRTISQTGIDCFFKKKIPTSVPPVTDSKLVYEDETSTPVDGVVEHKRILPNSSTLPSCSKQSPCSRKLATVPADSECKTNLFKKPFSIPSDNTRSAEGTGTDHEGNGGKRSISKKDFTGKAGSTNLLVQLTRRSTRNTRFDRYYDSGCHGMRNNVHRKWQRNSNVQLDRGGSNSEITCMEFDGDGVLLAVADGVGCVSIFDFDEVNAADMTSRQETKMQLPKEVKSIAPFIHFRMGSAIHRISAIKWNPMDENMLAMTFFNKKEIRIYDVSTTSENGPLYIRLSSGSNLVRSVGNWTLKFLPSKINKNKILVGGSDGTLQLWQFSNISNISSGKRGRLVWSINPWRAQNAGNGGLTEIAHLSANPSGGKSCLIITATSMGWFALMDINNCSRKSFSSELTPQIIRTWSLSQLGGIRKHVLPASKWMGIAKLYVWVDRPKTTLDHHSVKRCVTLGVITSGGWMISLQLDSTKNNMSLPTARILHRSPTVIKCDSTRTNFYKDSSASVPEFPSVCGQLDNAGSLVVVTKTKTMYQVLPDSDKRILDQSIASSGLINFENKDDEDGLTVVNRKGGGPITIPIKGKLKHLAIHPENEWMVGSIFVTNESQPSSIIQLLSLRSKNLPSQRKGVKAI